MHTRAALLVSITTLILVCPTAADAQLLRLGLGVGRAHWAHQPWPSPYRPYPMWVGGSVAVRIDVEPTDAEVFVNGYLAGTVDDFDGVFQRLRLRPGEHEIAIHREGHRTIYERRYFNPGSVLTIRRTMEPLAAGEPEDPRPVPAAAPPPPPPDRAAVERRPAPLPRRPDRPGALALRVEPIDAEIVIDGESRSLPADKTLLTLPLPPGRHRVEVRRDGYETYTEEVLIRPQATLALTVSLKRR